MNDKQGSHVVQVVTLPEGGVSIKVDGTELPSCSDISIYYREDPGEFRVNFTIATRDLELDAKAMTEVAACLRYTGPLDTGEDRKKLRCNTEVHALGEYSDFSRESGSFKARMELPDLLAIVEKWQGRQ